MAKATTTTDAPERSASIEVSPQDGQGNALLAAWQGVYHLFGGRATFEITDDGVIAHDFSVDAKYDPMQIVSDVSHRTRRLELIPTYLWIQGNAPADFTDAKEMTQWAVQYLRGSVEENTSRTPKYVKDAIQAYKDENSLAKKRGPRKKIFRVDNLSEIDETTLAGVDAAELAKLQETLQRALAAAKLAAAPATETATA